MDPPSTGPTGAPRCPRPDQCHTGTRLRPSGLRPNPLPRRGGRLVGQRDLSGPVYRPNSTGGHRFAQSGERHGHRRLRFAASPADPHPPAQWLRRHVHWGRIAGHVHEGRQPDGGQREHPHHFVHRRLTGGPPHSERHHRPRPARARFRPGHPAFWSDHLAFQCQRTGEIGGGH